VATQRLELMHLLDTDVLWALRRKREEDAGDPVSEWASALLPTTVFVSVVSLMELESGAAKIARKDKSGATNIRQWVASRVRPAFEGRILPIDEAVARRWATLGYADDRDGLLAATALEHGLTLATRHAPSFRHGKVKTCNPWTYAPETAELDWRQASQGPPLWLRTLFVRG
jgi:predicted nucleic acid-binding protein